MADIVRKGHWGELPALFDVFDRFSRWRADERDWGMNVACPVDIEENEKEFVITAECPGIPKDSISVTLEGNVLTVSGEKKEVIKEGKGDYAVAERRFGRFTRSFTLPARVDPSKIQASHHDGILSVVVPKSQEALPHRIEIAAGPIHPK
jgi:HSP20 family protein